MDLYQQFIHKSRYARWLPDEGRRETWEDTCERYCDFMKHHLKKNFDHDMDVPRIYEPIHSMEVMPSMRAMMTAGPALERCNVAGYNCSYLPCDSIRSFDECLYILMCGTGVGYSVEHRYVEQLPVVNEHFEKSGTTIVVQDSKAGWARAFRELISLLYVGQIPSWDLSHLRPAGAPLRTFGGRSSGPEPLNQLFEFTVRLLRNAAGRRLTTLECHDLMCYIASVVVVGGVRRSALISLSDVEDEAMRHCKSGDWYTSTPYRALANNSAVYHTKPDVSQFLKEWKALYDSKSGERGFFNREAATNQARRNGRRITDDVEYGTNPCSEIILRPFQFCNLTEVIVRSDDSPKDLLFKVRTGSILGTYQSTLTNFKYLRRIWRRTTEEERLLGASLTGIYDNEDLIKYSGNDLSDLKDKVIDVNKELSQQLGIPQSVATTCIKPSGTVSQLVNAASGIHPRHSKYYIRTVRASSDDPICQLMEDSGVPWEWDVMEPEDRQRTKVFSFPIKAPSSVTREQITAVEHLNTWKVFARDWCEHKPSITVNVKEDEWLQVANWVYTNFDIMSGVSFLPYTEHVYKQAPYQEIDKTTYDKLSKDMPKSIDWSKLQDYEKKDNTNASQELACTGGVCEIVDLT